MRRRLGWIMAGLLLDLSVASSRTIVALWIRGLTVGDQRTMSAGDGRWVQLESQPGLVRVMRGSQWSEFIGPRHRAMRWGEPQPVSSELAAIGVRGSPWVPHAPVRS